MMAQPLTAVICVLNSKYIHSSLAPWCLLAGVGAYCEKGITARVVEGTINEPLERVAQRIVAQNPQVIGFCCYIWNITATKLLVQLVKELLPSAVIVLGGPEVSYNAEAVLVHEPLVDFIISGEGELPFALLLNAIYNNAQVRDIPGLCRRSGDTILASPPNTPVQEPPSPYTQGYLAALSGRIAYLETSRGCPYSCAFCLSGRCGGVRFYGLLRAKQELVLLANSGTQTVKLVDRTFNANPKRAYALFSFIIENYATVIPRGVCFHFEIAGDILDSQTIDLLATAPVGAIQLEIGLQSFHSETLDAIHRKTDVKRLTSNIRRLLAGGNMHIHIDLIAGLPLEDFITFAESFNTAYALKPNMLQLGFLKLLHGAQMREDREEYPCEYSNIPPYEVTSTPWLSQCELKTLHNIEDAVERLYNSGRFRRTLEYLLTQTGLPPFALLGGFGAFCAMKTIEKMPLDDYTALVYEYFGSQKSVDKTALRDEMVCDRLATNSTGRLPKVLCTGDSALKTAIKQLAASPLTCPKQGVKRGVALLYGQGCIAYVDYKDKTPITGEYPLHKLPAAALFAKGEASI